MGVAPPPDQPETPLPPPGPPVDAGPELGDQAAWASADTLVHVSRDGDLMRVGAGREPVAMVHATCGKRTTAMLACDHCGEELQGRDVRVVAGPGLDDPAMVPARRKAATT